MSIWVLRGLRDGIVTTRWPRRPDEYAEAWRGPVTVRPGSPSAPGAAAPCPTGAIEEAPSGQVRVDRGKCILCGRCVAAWPEVFTWSAGATGPGAAGLARPSLVVPQAPETDEATEAVRGGGRPAGPSRPRGAGDR